MAAPCLVGAAACGGLPPPPIGTLELALSSGLGESRHRLVDAQFQLSGTEELLLRSEEDPLRDVLQRALPAGSYQARLLDGWQLERPGSEGGEAVPARLVSENPVSFEITTGQTTAVTFLFETDQGPASLGSRGQLRIGIEVDGAAATQIVFTEIMSDPAARSDAEGEWFELYNAGTAVVDIGGCSIHRGDQALELEGRFPIEAGGLLTFANGEQPGFVPDVVYRGVSLPNTGEHSLRLQCGGHLLDEVRFGVEGFPRTSGRSASLSVAYHDPIGNDSARAWCDAQGSLGEDFGSPGEINPACPER